MQLSEVKLGGCKTAKETVDKQPVQVIAVTGGKGGTGKTSIAINLAFALAAEGHRTMLLDADLGMANVDVLLGLEAQITLLDVLNGECRLEDIILDGTENLMIIPAASGIRQLANVGINECAGLVHAFSDLKEPVDTLVIDTATGITEVVTSFCAAATEVLVVVCNDPASFRDSAAQIQILSSEYGVTRFRILASMVRTAAEGDEIYGSMQHLVSSNHNSTCSYTGFIPFDESLRKAVSRHQAVVDVFPRSRAAMALINLARHVLAWPRPDRAGGHLEFFVERLVHNEDINLEVLS
ncbi:MAG: P-loop NTPase [Gammaproteobacteria bacterium]